MAEFENSYPAGFRLTEFSVNARGSGARENGAARSSRENRRNQSIENPAVLTSRREQRAGINIPL